MLHHTPHRPRLPGNLPASPSEAWTGLQSLEPRILLAANPLNKIRILNSSVTEGDAGTTAMTFTVKRTGGPKLISKRAIVRYATEESLGRNPAEEGVDYERKRGKVTFGKGETTQTITVTINGDTDVEPNERFNVLLLRTNRGVIVDGQGRGTILNDDDDGGGGALTLSVDDQAVAETDAGTTTLSFTVTLSAVSAQAVTVDYATSDDSATTGDLDYVADSDTLTFAPGETTKNITITINGDVVVEPDETFNVTLTNPTNASLLDAVGVGSILNDD